MKKITLITFFAFFSIIGFSQGSLEDKLLEVFSAEKVEFIIKDIQQKKYYNNIVFNSFEIKETRDIKFNKANYATMNSFELINLDGTTTVITSEELIKSIKEGTFNILRLNIDRDYKNTKEIVLGNTNYILRISSFQTLSKLQKQ